MKKLIALIIATLLALSSVCAFAATYRHDDLTFTYDDTLFEVTMDDHTDDEDLVILTPKDTAWGEETYVRIYLKDLDGDKFPTKDEFTAMPGASEVTQGDWNGFKDVLMYTVTNDSGSTESYFTVPIYDDDEIEDMLAIVVSVSKIDNEDVEMARSDAISAILDSLKVDD